MDTASLPQTMSQASISLILKKNKDPLCCGSYRTISLLNLDYKILAKLLAMRLETVLPSIISPDQTGFIKNRYAFSNVRRLFHVMYNPSNSTEPEFVISLDAEKAFDRVEWGYLFRTLGKFGLGEKMIAWISLLYSSHLRRSEPITIIKPISPSLEALDRDAHCPLCSLLLLLSPSLSRFDLILTLPG